MEIGEALGADFMTWFIGFFIINIVTLATNILSFIKTTRMMPKALAKADNDLSLSDIEIRDKKLDLADHYSDANEKLLIDKQEISSKFSKMKEDYGMLHAVIGEQAILINRQTLQTELQQENLEKQTDIIKTLNIELASFSDKYEECHKAIEILKKYNEELIEQLKQKNIIPVACEKCSTCEEEVT